MINFRFHIVSLIAVFLALTIGIMVGATVIDRGLVDQLRRQVDAVGDKDNGVRKRNADLRKQVAALQTFIDQSAGVLGGRRLAGTTVVPVAVRGTDGGAVQQTVATLRSAGANVPAVVWMEQSWALGDRSVGDKLASAIGTPPVFTTAPTPTPSTTRITTAGATTTLAPDVEQLRHHALDVLAQRLVAGNRAGPDPLVSLQAAGFVAVDGAGQGPPDLTVFPARSARMIVIGGDDTAKLSLTLATPLVQAMLDSGASIGLCEARHTGKATDASRGDVVNGVRRDEALAARVPTVDDVDLAQGRVALVLALEELGRGAVGHYGVGRGAKRQIPPPPGAP